MESLITFTAGASYGLTTVLVGQPLDTIKTRMQGMPRHSKFSMLSEGTDLFRREGMKGLYRGGLPLFLGGSFMRSAQFGVSSKCHDWLKSSSSSSSTWGLPQHYKILGIFDYQVILSGIAGGLGRAVIEIPTDFFKTRRQVEQTWTLRCIADGAVVTMGRNTILFTSFMVYIDLAKQACRAGLVPSFLMTADSENLTPFAKGAVCANLAWMTCWPFDVVKTQRQSGNYNRNVSSWTLLRDNMASGRMYRGVVPGLMRSSVSNGTSMVVYEFVLTTLSEKAGVGRKDMA